MKQKYLSVGAAALFAISGLNAQSVIFYEDFEGSPVTSVVNTIGGTILPNGVSNCGRASRGNVSHYNSTNVDFDGAANSSFFLGANPESPCGGYYMATLRSADTLDLSGFDSVRFSCRYFLSNTLGWGGGELAVRFENGITAFAVDTLDFTTRNAWDEITVKLPSSILTADVRMIITMAGGEGAGLDEIRLQNISFDLGTAAQQDETVKIYPVPADEMITVEWGGPDAVSSVAIISAEGKICSAFAVLPGQPVVVSTGDLLPGMYMVRLDYGDGRTAFRKMIKN